MPVGEMQRQRTLKMSVIIMPQCPFIRACTAKLMSHLCNLPPSTAQSREYDIALGETITGQYSFDAVNERVAHHELVADGTAPGRRFYETCVLSQSHSLVCARAAETSCAGPPHLIDATLYVPSLAVTRHGVLASTHPCQKTDIFSGRVLKQAHCPSIHLPSP